MRKVRHSKIRLLSRKQVSRVASHGFFTSEPVLNNPFETCTDSQMHPRCSGNWVSSLPSLARPRGVTHPRFLVLPPTPTRGDLRATIVLAGAGAGACCRALGLLDSSSVPRRCHDALLSVSLGRARDASVASAATLRALCTG